MLHRRLWALLVLTGAGAPLMVGCGSADLTHSIAPPPVDTTHTPGETLTGVVFDLRFKGVGVLSGLPGGIGSDIPGAGGQWFTQFSGSPLSIGTGICAPNAPDYGCAWVFTGYPLPANDTGLTTLYEGDYWLNMGSYFQTVAPNDTVITSLDLEPADSLFAFSAYIAGADAGYTLGVHTVAPSALQAAASQQGTERRVITALSFLNGQVEYFSYGWQHDTTSSGYDVQVDTALSLTTVPTAAQALAAAGYTITAFGGDSTDGFVLVGTRAHGVTTPRKLQVVPNSRAGIPGYATVVFTFSAETSTFTVIAEQ